MYQSFHLFFLIPHSKIQVTDGHKVFIDGPYEQRTLPAIAPLLGIFNQE